MFWFSFSCGLEQYANYQRRQFNTNDIYIIVNEKSAPQPIF